jgi:hypothetical protein
MRIFIFSISNQNVYGIIEFYYGYKIAKTKSNGIYTIDGKTHEKFFYMSDFYYIFLVIDAYFLFSILFNIAILIHI